MRSSRPGSQAPMNPGSGPANCGNAPIQLASGRAMPHNYIMASKHPKHPRDLNQWAKHMVDLATGNAQEPDPNQGKDAKAVSLGRRGGLKGGAARAAKMSPERRAEI